MALLVAMTGLSGTGKTTALYQIREDLHANGFRVGMVDIETVGYAPQLHAVAKTLPPDDPARSMMLWALRKQQHDLVVAMEAENRTDAILVDGYWERSFVLDLCGNRVPLAVLAWVGQCIKRRADITFLFEAPLKVIRSRKISETIKDDTAFAERVIRGYNKLAASCGWTRVDATRSPQEIKEDCLKVILAALRGVKS